MKVALGHRDEGNVGGNYMKNVGEIVRYQLHIRLEHGESWSSVILLRPGGIPALAKFISSFQGWATVAIRSKRKWPSDGWCESGAQVEWIVLWGLSVGLCRGDSHLRDCDWRSIDSAPQVWVPSLMTQVRRIWRCEWLRSQVHVGPAGLWEIRDWCRLRNSCGVFPAVSSFLSWNIPFSHLLPVIKAICGHDPICEFLVGVSSRDLNIYSAVCEWAH